MSALIKIALRNVILNPRKSILLGITIFFSSFLLMASNATMNGVEQQVLRGYLNLQSGHVIVMWDSLKNTNHSDTQRFINIYESLSFDPKKDSVNKNSISRLDNFLIQNKNDIEACFPTIRRNARIQTDGKMDGAFIIYSLFPESRDYIINTKTLAMKDGQLLSDNGICISEDKANKNNLKIGDKIEVEAATTKGITVTKTFTVTGIYANGAFYDNYYGFVSENTARQLFDIGEGYFDVARIYLKDMNKASGIASKLDKYLIPEDKALRAESYSEANTFFTTNPRNIKIIFTVFIFFLLAIIALGLRSTVRMNLFQRMKEFGTIRAIGFSRLQSYLIIFFEVFFHAVISFLVALAAAIILVLVFAKSGVYVGPAVSSMFGGERFYPDMKIFDVVFALVIITVFSLMATLNPGLKLCYQKIVDIMDKRQKRIYPLLMIIKGLFSRSEKKIQLP